MTGIGHETEAARAVTNRMESRKQYQVSVFVLGYDRRLADDLNRHLLSCQYIRMLDADESTTADVLVVLTTAVTDVLLAELADMTREATNPEQCIVLVSGPLRERHLARAVSCGVVSILSRRETNARLIIRAILTSHAGGAVLPEMVARWLVDEARRRDTNETGSTNRKG